MLIYQVFIGCIGLNLVRMNEAKALPSFENFGIMMPY